MDNTRERKFQQSRPTGSRLIVFPTNKRELFPHAHLYAMPYVFFVLREPQHEMKVRANFKATSANAAVNSKISKYSNKHPVVM